MVEIICGACGHSGSHGQTLPLGTGMQKRCADCAQCKAAGKDQER